jgi:hypothetical protein
VVHYKRMVWFTKGTVRKIFDIIYLVVCASLKRRRFPQSLFHHPGQTVVQHRLAVARLADVHVIGVHLRMLFIPLINDINNVRF